MTPQLRTTCCMPACRSTRKADEPDEEWLCRRHFMLASRAARVEYDAAWREADKADWRRADGLDISAAPFVRVTAAWEQVKVEAFAAAGIAS